jgi:hypothetical protein
MLHQISGKEYPRLLQRYAKLSSDKLDKLESLADQYLEGSIKSSALPLFSGVSLGLVIGSVSSLPALGIMAGSGLVYSALSNAFQRSMNAEYIKDMGMLAPFLKEADLVTYADLVGVEAVLMEISQAYDDRQKVSPTARRLMRKIGHPLQRRTIARYVETLKPEVAEPTTLSPQRSQLIESAQNSTAATHQPSEYYDSVTGKGSIVLDLVTQSPGLSRLMIGGQRTGKSYFAAVASRELARSLGWKIFHINLASYGAEDEYYWTHAYKSVRGDLASITDANVATDLIADAIDCITEFISTQGAILIVDEITFTGSKYGKWDASRFLRLVAEQISALTSSGMKRERVIWALCPELVAGAMKDSTKAIKSLKLLYLAIVPSMTIDWQGQRVGFDGELHKQVTANYDGIGLPTTEQMSACRRHKQARIAYLNGQWVPIGDLPQIEQPKIALPSAQKVEMLGSSTDPIEAAILEFLKSRPDGATGGRIRADKYALKSLSMGELEEYLSVLVEEGKVVRNGKIFHVA